MGQVYGRMSLPGVVGVYSSRWSAGDHHANCPSKAKPGFRSNTKLSPPAPSSARRGRRRSLSIDSSQGSQGRRRQQLEQEASVRMTRQAARQLAIQQAAERAAAVRRSARLAGSRQFGPRAGGSAAGGAAATLPTTLRRSARIAGFRYIGHRIAADFSPAAGAGERGRRLPANAAGPAHSLGPGSARPNEVRRSVRLMRA